MSISCAPARTACSVSSTLIGVKLWPDGKAVATEAMRTVVPRRCPTQSAMRSGYTHTAATDGMVASPAFGRIALAHIAATLPGVSAPSSVVRSMHRTARSSAHSFDDFLIERLASAAARSSAPTSSTLRTPRIREPRWVSERAVAMLGLCDGMKRTNLLVGLAYVMVAAACGSNQPAARTTPSTSPPPPAISSPSPPPSPPPPQRQEPALPAPVEETGAAAAGGSLYVMGGFNSRGNVGPAEAYDPANNAWTVLPSLPVARNHVSGFWAGGAACVAGGRSPTTARVDCFDPAAGAWSRLPDLPQPASGAGATTFASGDVVMTGGQDASETRIVDQLAFYPPGGSWISPDKMLSPRHGFELAVFEGRAWACGGGSAPGLHPVATCTSLGDRPSPNN